METEGLDATRMQLRHCLEKIRTKSKTVPLNLRQEQRLKAMIEEIEQFNLMYMRFAELAVAGLNVPSRDVLRTHGCLSRETNGAPTIGTGGDCSDQDL